MRRPIPKGRPWSERKKYVWWDAEEGKWTRLGDAPDFPPTKAPDYEPPEDAKEMEAIAGDKPFILHPDGRGWLYAASGLVDGPLPVHYEPHESPFENRLYAQGRTRPARSSSARRTATTPAAARPADEVFPFVLTTYRLTEHHTAGGMSRTIPYLAELQPEFFCEVSPALAARARPRPRRLGDDRHRAQLRRGPGDGDRAHPAADDPGPHDASGRGSLPLGRRPASSPATRPTSCYPLVLDNNVHISEYKAATCDIRPGRRPRGPARLELRRGVPPARGGEGLMKLETYAWPGDVRRAAKPRVGFFTDTSVCIGCKACEVACKEWNQVPMSMQGFTGKSYDNTVDLGADTWRHVAFIEQTLPVDARDGGRPRPGRRSGSGRRARTVWPPTRRATSVRWLMASDVCKHCTHAACLEVCPTGALFRTEFGTVVVQEDVCNGCGYCVPACPFGVLDKREGDGRVWKCTLCYDRLKDDKEPACAQTCPTNSIQFGELTELRERAEHRLAQLQQAGQSDARLYLADATTGSAAAGRSSCCSMSPRSTACPRIPVDTVRDIGTIWAAAGAAALALGAGLVAAAFGGRR